MKKKRKLIILISSILIGLLLPISLVSATTNETYNYNSDKSKLTRVVVISSNEKYIPEEILSKYFDNEKITREYKLTDTKKDELKTIDKKEVEKQEVVEVSTNDGSGIPDSFLFDQDGYNGTLNKVDVSYYPILNKVDTSYEQIDSITKEYTNLATADYVNIPKTVNDNGFTWYLLTDRVTFTGVGDSYSANAIYSKVTYVPDSRIDTTGYTATVTYKGTVAKDNIDTYKYTLTYTLDKESKENNILPVIISVVSGVAIIGSGGLLVKFLLLPFIKKRNNED